MPRSRPEQIEFQAVAPGEVLATLAELFAEAQGWINLFPEVEEDDARAVTPSQVASWFRAPGPPIPQTTLIAPTDGRRGRSPAQLGMTHGVGTPVLRRLADQGLALPPGWTMVQDHVRRGLVLRLADPPDAEEALTWSLRAAEALCPIPVTGGWLAEIHRA